MQTILFNSLEYSNHFKSPKHNVWYNIKPWSKYHFNFDFWTSNINILYPFEQLNSYSFGNTSLRYKSTHVSKTKKETMKRYDEIIQFVFINTSDYMYNFRYLYSGNIFKV